MRDLTRNMGTVNIPVWILSNTWRLSQVNDAKFDMNISNEKLLEAAKCHIHRSDHFWVNKWKPTGSSKNTPTFDLGEDSIDSF